MKQDIKVSIICNTYNHKNYIREAIESFLMQKTDFAFEILIHDDASTDGTTDIVREYEKKYPNLIKPIYQKENQYSQRIDIGLNFQYPRVKGKYIALCEGDDYWTDCYKLQKQYEAMEMHPELDICAHAARYVEAETKTFLGNIEVQKVNNGVCSIEDLILNSGGYIATNSFFFRSEINKNIPRFRRFMPLDYTIQIHGGLKGGMLFLPDNMSDYRVMSKGSWSSYMANNKQASIEHQKKKCEMLLLLNEDTDFKYDKVIQQRIHLWEFNIEYAQERYKILLSKKYKDIFSTYSFKARLKIRLKAYFPWLLKLKRKLSCK